MLTGPSFFSCVATGRKEAGMKVLAKIIDHDLVEGVSKILHASGLETWVSKKGDLFAVLPLLREEGNEKTFDVPAEIRFAKPQIVMECCETGGNGLATVVAGSTGKKLKPFNVLWDVSDFSQSHAFFALYGSVVLVDVQKDGRVRIRKFLLFSGGSRISFTPLTDDDREVVLQEELIWEGEESKMPSQHLRFREAVDAALEKARSVKAGVFYAIPVDQKKETTNPSPQYLDLLDALDKP